MDSSPLYCPCKDKQHIKSIAKTGTLLIIPQQNTEMAKTIKVFKFQFK